MMLSGDRRSEIMALLDRERQYHGHSTKPGTPELCTSCGGQTWPCDVIKVVNACQELLDITDLYGPKFDALIAAVFETLDDETRDRVLARAKELEAEQDDDAGS